MTHPSSIDFVLVGPMKTGTSWANEYLAQHPGVSVPTTVKETYYFSQNFDKGATWYQTQFTHITEPAVVGEVSPTYFADPEAAKRIFDQNNNTKIVITVREPWSRFFSHFKHNVHAGYLDANDDLESVYLKSPNIKEQSSYLKYIEMWTQLFGPENTLVVLYEELDTDPQLFVDKITRHLNLKPEPIPQNLKKVVGGERTPVSVTVVKFLYSISAFFRRQNFHFLINAGKKLGLKRLLFTKQKKQALTFSDADKAITQLTEEAVQLEKQLSIDIQPWREVWRKRKAPDSQIAR